MSDGSTLEAVAPRSRDALLEHLRSLRHDLGKYVAFQLRWLPEQPSDDELREALLADLARTRSAGERVESAPALWARLRAPLVGLEPLADGSRVDLSCDPDLLVIDAAMAVVTPILEQLDGAPRSALDAARRAAMEASSATRSLQKRARSL